MKAVAFVVLDNIFHVDAVLVQRGDHLVGFFDVDARVLRALRDQQRRADVVRVQRR